MSILQWFGDYLTDKTNEAIASPARFRTGNGTGKRAKSVKARAYDDYVERMGESSPSAAGSSRTTAS